MSAIRFSLSQIEAFACVCESGNLTRAAKKLGKDRTTVSELIEYLELDLGYSLFDRRTRPLTLTDEGQLLYRQARLFLHEAQAFGQIAEQIPKQMQTQFTLCYDNFIPRNFLVRLAHHLQQQGIHLNMLCMQRADAEVLIERGDADIGLYQALNRSISERFKWRAIGNIELAVYAKSDFFKAKPVSLLALASHNQLIPFNDLPEPLALRLQIADHTQCVNELDLLKPLLCAGQGWAFLPTHLSAENWTGIEMVETEVGHAGLVHPIVALWKPGQGSHYLLLDSLDKIGFV